MPISTNEQVINSFLYGRDARDNASLDRDWETRD